MPAKCCVGGCGLDRGELTQAEGISFFSLPKDDRRRRAWLRAIGRSGWEPRPSHRVCGRHFVSGWPSKSRDDVDYRPTLFLRQECHVVAGRASQVTLQPVSETIAAVAEVHIIYVILVHYSDSSIFK